MLSEEQILSEISSFCRRIKRSRRSLGELSSSEQRTLATLFSKLVDVLKSKYGLDYVRRNGIVILGYSGGFVPYIDFPRRILYDPVFALHLIEEYG